MFTKIEHKTIEKLEKLHAEGEISGTELILLLTISRHGWGQAGNRNPCLKSIKDLAKIVGRSERQVRRSLAKLKKLKFIDYIYRIRKDGRIITTKSKKIALGRQAGNYVERMYFILREPGIGTNIKLDNPPQRKKTILKK